MRGKKISDEQIEQIKATFAETGSLTATAKAAGCGLATAKKYATNFDQFEELRTQKRVGIIERIAVAQGKLIDAMVDDAHLAKASVQELATAFGIVTDKQLLLTGQPTSRTETMQADPAARLTPEEMEQAARIRERMAAQVTD